MPTSHSEPKPRFFVRIGDKLIIGRRLVMRDLDMGGQGIDIIGDDDNLRVTIYPDWPNREPVLITVEWNVTLVEKL